MLFLRVFLAAVGSLCLGSSSAWMTTRPSHKKSISTCLESSRGVPDTAALNRREALRNVAFVASSVLLFKGEPSFAAETSATAEITDKIFINVKGIPGTDEQKRIVIGLFGKDSPNSVAKLKSLVTNEGVPAPCRPKAERVLQKEQLEGECRLKSQSTNTMQLLILFVCSQQSLQFLHGGGRPRRYLAILSDLENHSGRKDRHGISTWKVCRS